MELGPRRSARLVFMLELIRLDDIPSFGLAVERYHTQIRRPPLKLSHPIRNSGIGHHDQRRERFPGRRDLANERGDLDGFTLHERTSIQRQHGELLNLPDPSRQPRYKAACSTNYGKAN